MSNRTLRNAITKRAHRERSQPHKRRKLGLLEKHKDYVLRARDFHRKENTIRNLQVKAANRNPEEFYFKMNSTQTKDGVHIHKRDGDDDHTYDELKMFKIQDLRYLRLRVSQEKKKIEKLEAVLQGLPEQTKSNLKGEIEMEERKKPNQHRKFFYSNEERKEYLECVKKPTDSQITVSKEETRREKGIRMRKIEKVAKFAKKRKHRYADLEERRERLKKLNAIIKKLQTEQNLMTKGRRTKIIETDRFGDEDPEKTYYKWKLQRRS